MPLSDLTEAELKIVQQCLDAAADGKFFEDWEFHTLFGVDREVVRQVAKQFPLVDEFDESEGGNDDSWLVINNTFVNLIGYPHRKDAELAQWVSASKGQVEEVFRKWRG